MSETDQQPPDTDTPAPQEPESDPFEGWPEAESSAVIEDASAEGVSVEHVRGEVQVPDGFAVLEGTPLGRRRSVGVVVSRFNGGVTDKLLQGALDALIEAGVSQDAITVVPVPGAFELPLAARRFATDGYAAVICLGCVIQGETPHFTFVCAEAARGCTMVMQETGVPVAFGVITAGSRAQALARAGGTVGNKGNEAAAAALELAGLLHALQ